MSILPYIVVAIVRCSCAFWRLPAYAAVELSKSELAVGEQRTHATRLGERQCLAIVGLAALGMRIQSRATSVHDDAGGSS